MWICLFGIASPNIVNVILFNAMTYNYYCRRINMSIKYISICIIISLTRCDDVFIAFKIFLTALIHDSYWLKVLFIVFNILQCFRWVCLIVSKEALGSKDWAIKVTIIVFEEIGAQIQLLLLWSYATIESMICVQAHCLPVQAISVDACVNTFVTVGL